MENEEKSGYKEEKLENSFLLLESLYPDAKDFFSFVPKSLIEISETCIFVIDTNILLLPFNFSEKNLGLIKSIYSKLTEEKRLIIPGHVIREFARRRPRSYEYIYDKLKERKNHVESVKKFIFPEIPLVNSLSQYQETMKILDDINKSIGAFEEKIDYYSKSILKIMGIIKNWTWNDPVSKIYQQLFSENVVLDFKFDREKIKEEWYWRRAHNIPPTVSSEDANKDDNQEGDLLIWKSIINIGKEKKNDVIFVTHDSKSDWWQKHGSLSYTRFELVDEFRRVSNGKIFQIIKFSEFMKLQGVKKEQIEEITEKQMYLPSSSNIHSIGYNEENHLLEIEFKNGSIYHYFNVPNQIYEGLMSASSHGKFFNSHIKGKNKYKKKNDEK